MSEIQDSNVRERGQDLMAAALPLDDQRLFVPEPAVKAYLARRGCAVPRGVTVPAPNRLSDAARSLRAPFALKAIGPAFLHKTARGAVRLNLRLDELESAAQHMVGLLQDEGHVVNSLLLEEQQPPGIELLIGATVIDGVTVMACGLGGIHAELFDELAVRLWPLTKSGAEQLIDDFRGARRLEKAGLDSRNRGQLVQMLFELCGEQGVIAELREIGLIEFEMNPVILGKEGPCCVDARLIVSNAPDKDQAVEDKRNLTPIFKPNSVAVAGSFETGKGLPAVHVEAYRRFGWTSGLYRLSSGMASKTGPPTYSSVAAMPGGHIDYLQIYSPPSDVLRIVEETGSRASSIQIYTRGIGEMGDAGKQLEQRIVDTARTNGVLVIGPNSAGAYCPAGRQTFQLNSSKLAGHISVVTQSGGLAADLLQVGQVLGLRFSKVLAIGNAADVTCAEVLEHFVDDEETSVIGMVFEGIPDTGRFVRAVRAASARKPVVVLAAGITPRGAMAVASHTGMMVTNSRLLQAVAASTGMVIVESYEDLMASLLAFQFHLGRDTEDIEPSLLMIGTSGGHAIIATDLCARAGLPLSELSAQANERLSKVRTTDAKIQVNPVDFSVAPALPTETLREALEAVLGAQRFSDVLVHFAYRSFVGFEDFFPHGSGLDALLERLDALAAPLPGNPRIYVWMRTGEMASRQDLEAIRARGAALRLPLFLDLKTAASAISSLQTFHRFARQP